MRNYTMEQITRSLKSLARLFAEHEEYPQLQVNVAYLLYDLCTELGLPERAIYEILGYRGYLYVAKTRYYATPEGKQILDEALNELLNEELGVNDER